MKNVNRRDFLKLSTNSLLALAGLLGIGGLVRYLSYEFDSPPRNEFDIGPESDYPLGTRTVLAHIPAVVIHDNNGFKVMSLTCTHLGCMVEPRNFGFECPCHGSRYSPAGKVLKGPAASDLPKLRIETAGDGNLHVFRT
jgi:nitrite reductase/ring-hydroxylating ferredoxin subunit